METRHTHAEPRPALDDHETWSKIRNALRKRLSSFSKGAGVNWDDSDVEDATQDAFLRVVSLFEKHPEKSIGWYIIRACIDERHHCFRRVKGSLGYCYRVAHERNTAPRVHWSKRFDPRRIRNRGVGDATLRAAQGLPMNPEESKLLAEYPNRMRVYFENGASVASIADTFGVSAKAVRKAADVNGWTSPEKTKSVNALQSLRRIADLLRQ